MEARGEQPILNTRRKLFSYYQTLLSMSDERALEERATFETGHVKTFILEIGRNDLIKNGARSQELKQLLNYKDSTCTVVQLGEEGFFLIEGSFRKSPLAVYLDTATNPRFWFGYSLIKAAGLDSWLDYITRYRTELDFAWLWPLFLERIQQRGSPRGFGLSYDYKKFSDDDDNDFISELKMKVFGGRRSGDLYQQMKHWEPNRIILSAIRMKESNGDPSLFAMQNFRYQSRFSLTGTDFSVHQATLSFVRSRYEAVIRSIESCSFRWVEKERHGFLLEGYAIHFIPTEGKIPVEAFYEHIMNGTKPFMLLGLIAHKTDYCIISNVVDLHSGDELRFELCPDILSIYIKQGTCGNTIARFYTNLQHYFGAQFRVESDNGLSFFKSDPVEPVHRSM